jgi:hypothetical protein
MFISKLVKHMLWAVLAIAMAGITEPAAAQEADSAATGPEAKPDPSVEGGQTTENPRYVTGVEPAARQKVPAPPPLLAEALKTRPSNLRLGIALATQLAGTFGIGPEGGLMVPRPMAFAYVSFHPSRGIVTDAYCASRTYGEAYAQQAADEYADALTAAGVDTEWKKGVSGACNYWRSIFGLYLGMAFGHDASVRTDGRFVLRNVSFTISAGASIRMSDYLAILLGPSLSGVTYERADDTKDIQWGLGGMVGLGGNLDLGKHFIK